MLLSLAMNLHSFCVPHVPVTQLQMSLPSSLVQHNPQFGVS